MSKAAGSSHSGALIELRNVTYKISGRTLLQQIDLSAAESESLVLLGRSGAGKSTVLKLINRLLTPTYGEVVVGDRSTTDWDAIALRRSIGWVIQETGLFPHYSVEKNISLVPELERWPADRIRSRVAEMMQLVGLSSELRTRYPHQLSGGQRQRVGVARALAANPKILLMDEPFGALDALTRADLQREFLQLQQRVKKTVVLVTHDVREALLLATRIALLDNGKLIGVFAKEQFVRSEDERVRSYLVPFREAALSF